LVGVLHTYIGADAELPAGTHQVRMEFAYDGGGLGKGGTVTLYVDGQQVGQGRIERTHAFLYSMDEVTARATTSISNGRAGYGVTASPLGCSAWVSVSRVRPRGRDLPSATSRATSVSLRPEDLAARRRWVNAS
jgi:hypothetical protein